MVTMVNWGNLSTFTTVTLKVIASPKRFALTGKENNPNSVIHLSLGQ